MSKRSRFATRAGLALLCVTMSIAIVPPATATPARQSDPAAWCAEGMRLSNEDKDAEAMPLLQAGFAGRAQGQFVRPGELTSCALRLAVLLLSGAEPMAALEPAGVALALAREDKDIYAETLALFAIGSAYSNTWRYAEGDRYYLQMLELSRAHNVPDQELSALGSLAGNARMQDRYQQALDYSAQALALSRQSGLEEETAKLLLQRSDLLFAQSRDAAHSSTSETDAMLAEAQTAAEEARDLYVANKNELGEARALAQLGAVSGALKLPNEAINYVEAALAAFERAENGTQQVLTLFELIGIHEDLGRHEAVIEVVGRVRGLLGQLPAHIQESAEITASMSASIAYQKLGRIAEAIETGLRARELARSQGDPTTEIAILNGLALNYRLAGRLDIALSYHEQALQVARESGKTEEAGLALEFIGGIFRLQGRDEQALQYFQEAHELLEGSSGQVGAGIDIANLLTSQGRYAEAKPFLQKALASGEQSDDERLINLARSSFVEVLVAEGDHERALDYLEQSLAFSRDQADLVAIAVDLNRLGNLLSESGRYDEAFAHYREAISVAREGRNPAQELSAWRNLGLTHLERDERKAAFADLSEAVRLLEALRPNAGSDLGQIGFAARYADIYEEAARLSLQLEAPQQAFAFVERGRARAFLDSMASGEVQLSDTAENALFQRERELYAARESAREAHANALVRFPDDAQLLAKLRSELQTVEAAYAAALSQLEQSNEHVASLRPSPGVVPSLSVIKAQLPQDAALVAYHVGAETTLAFVITHNTFAAHELPAGQAALRQQVKTLRAFDHPIVSPVASELYRKLIVPLKLPASTRQLILVPHGVLHYLPFAALVIGSDWLSGSPRYLSDEFTLTSLPSVAALTLSQLRPGEALEPLTPLVMGDPDGSLIHASGEARRVAELLGGDALLGAAASEKVLRARVAEAGVVHLATHGVFDPFAPLRSFIVLAPTDADVVAGAESAPSTPAPRNPTPCHPDSMGCFDVAEIYGVAMPKAELVVLSACETGVNTLSADGPLAVTAGDEVVGLTRAVFFAGSPRVVSTLWKVDDAASTLLMERFYIHLQAGEPPAEALRLAQREVREHRTDDGERPYARASFWAGYVLYGEGATPIWVSQPWWHRVPVWGAIGVPLCAALGLVMLMVRRWPMVRNKESSSG